MIVEPRRHLQGERGLVAAVISSAAFATSGIFATSLLRAGWSPAAAVAVRLAIAALALAGPGVRALRAAAPMGTRRWLTLVAYGLVPVAGCQLCYFEAVSRLSVAVALLVEYSGIVLVLAWMWARHGQAPTPVASVGALSSLLGLVLVLDLIGSHRLSFVGLIWALGAAVGLAGYFLLSARRGEDHLPPIVVAWGGVSVGAVAMIAMSVIGALPFDAPRTTVVLAHTRLSWVVPVLGIGLVAAAFAYVTGIIAVRALGARVASFVCLAEVLFAAFYAWAFLGEKLTVSQLVGAALVVVGIALVRLGEPEPDGSAESAGAMEVMA